MNLNGSIELFCDELPVEREAAGTLRPVAGSYVEKVGTLWCVRSPNPMDRNFGCYNTQEEAEDKLRSIR